jgi:ATP-dependent protease Clp ATPase subunit
MLFIVIQEKTTMRKKLWMHDGRVPYVFIAINGLLVGYTPSSQYAQTTVSQGIKSKKIHNNTTTEKPVTSLKKCNIYLRKPFGSQKVLLVSSLSRDAVASLQGRARALGPTP